jgi:probable HAF family extracellular repeat protein
MRTRTPLGALAACLALAACDATDGTTAPNAPPNAAPNADVGVVQPPTYLGYALTDISGGLPSAATDINAHGWIVGYHVTANGQHGFVRHADGTVEDLPPLPGGVSNVVTWIDDADEIVGTSTAADGTSHAWYRAPGGAVQRLREATWCVGTSHANAIDDAGEIAGGCGGGMAVWSGASQMPWAPTGGWGDLNDIANGTPVGTEVVSSSTSIAYAWRTVDGNNFPDTPWGASRAWISAISGSLHMVGGYELNGVDHGFVASFATVNGLMTTPTLLLPHPVYGVSGAGRLVGWYGAIHPSAYTIAPGISFAETPLPPTTLDRAAVKVNRCGSIVGDYFPLGIPAGPRAALWTKPQCD